MALKTYHGTVPTITAFKASPDRGRGLARDMSVRWALAEVDQPYEVRLVTFAEMKKIEHLTLQPFGQIPTYEHGELKLFESGSIVLHIAQNYSGLLPEDSVARAHAISWLFAALSTMEAPIVELSAAELLESEKPWFAERQEILKERARHRLQQLSQALGSQDWLEGTFTAGDLMMICVLRRLKSTGLLGEFQNLSAYVSRGEERPAFKQAFAAQHAVFVAAQSAAK
ncbi:MAG: glutathione S-transferase family protein [Proteobacteria bacterium]|nr:MAG: glutathione S-transferase family protein [Pseudomonadota bacterium]